MQQHPDYHLCSGFEPGKGFATCLLQLERSNHELPGWYGQKMRGCIESWYLMHGQLVTIALLRRVKIARVAGHRYYLRLY
jgi:hypothetical protein